MLARGAVLRFAVRLFIVIVVSSRSSSADDGGGGGGIDFIYQGFQHAANLTMDGSAKVLHGGALQLTNDSNRLVGHAFHAAPVRFLDDGAGGGGGGVVSSFSTAFVLDIVTVGSGGGHGLAFVVAPSITLPGASPEIYLGILGPHTNGNASDHVFAVEFDTVMDLEMNDTNGNHVGVDVNSLVSVVSEPVAYYAGDGSTKVPVQLESAQQILAWIDYDGGSSILNVTVAPATVTERPRRPLISTKLDLLPIFKENMYVGFSSATGKLASSHYILAWSFRTNGVARSIDLRRLPKVPRQSSPPPRLLIIKFAAVACAGTLTLIAAAMVAVLWLRRRAALADTLEEWELEHPQRIPYKELYKATKGFKESELLGAGGFGQVYRGVLRRRSGEAVAIKRISNGTRQGMREFVAEVASLGRMRHRNLVELRGWCKHDQDLLLVYEFMPGGSLDARLLEGCYDEEEARLVLWLGLMCSQARPEARPSMRQVCRYLDGEEMLQEDATPAAIFSGADSSDLFGGSFVVSMTSSSAGGTMSASSLQGGR
uniref:Protein kinase domain-containing protein n=1 Tax=Oryza barthii TaxID=65489 RepID=A0A0D3GE36_9ORYZ